jgi:prepilin-type N-terminal cleavage/methylation domain-containing protein
MTERPRTNKQTTAGPANETYMKTTASPTNRTRQMSGFTLIEMIGVLAVIAILAALLLPKVFSAIADAKINNAVVSTETIKTACADHYGKYGRFNTSFGTNITAAPILTYDTNLLFEALIDKPFQTKLGTNWAIVMAKCETAATTVAAPNAAPTGTVAGESSYSLDGVGAAPVNEATGDLVMEAVLQGVAQADAQAISLRIDGPSMTPASSASGDDFAGRVKYKDASGGPTTVYIYLTHR